MRLAWHVDDTLAGGYYRSIGPLAALTRRGHRLAHPHNSSQLTGSTDLRTVDLLHVHRYSDDGTLRLIRHAKRAGAAVVWDNDDDLAALPRTVRAYRSHGGLQWERARVRLKRIFAEVDLVTAPNEQLARLFAALGARRTHVIENYIVDDFLAAAARPSDDIVIGWIAGAEHRMDLEELPIRDVLDRLLVQRPNVRVVTIGAGLGLASPRYTHVAQVQFDRLLAHAASFDIGIAPLADLPFNRARSNIKLKEYAAVGVPWLASPIGPYQGLGEREGGRLVPDDGWYEALSRLIDKPRARRKLAARAQQWGSRQRISQHAELWEHQFEQALAHVRTAS